MKRWLSLLVSAIAMLVLSSGAAGNEYPHRPKYPDINLYELSRLVEDYNKVQIVDVRSAYEFDTLHIKGAENIPLNSPAFPSAVRELAAKTPKTMVFYCNGKTCDKSYIAARQAARLGLKNIAAYDAGVFDWAKAKPDLTVLLGKSPINTNDLISSEQLRERMLSPAEFQKRVEAGGKVSVIDVRDRIQRDILLFPFKETRISLNEEAKLTEFIKKEVAAGKTLFIYDKVGKQVDWLQYRLNAMGVRNYYFMQGGAEAMYKAGS